MNQPNDTEKPSAAKLKLVEMYGEYKVRGRGIGKQVGYLDILSWLEPPYKNIVKLEFDANHQLTLSYHRLKLLELEPKLKTVEQAMKYLRPYKMKVIKISRGRDPWKTWSFVQTDENKLSITKISVNQSESEEVMEPQKTNSLPKRERQNTMIQRKAPRKRVKHDSSIVEVINPQPMIDANSTEIPTEILSQNGEEDPYHLPDINLDLDIELHWE